MGLFWFMLMVGITGMAVDSTNGFRSRTMLQATADASALAAAIDLPNNAAVTATAVSYADNNMGVDLNGTVLNTADVHVGHWNASTNSLDTTSGFPDSVMVTVRQTEENSNPVPVNFLRIVGLSDWNVQAQAVAQRFIPECLKDGLVAEGTVNIESGNGFVNNICIHGQQGVEMQIDNSFQSGVTVSMPDPDSQLSTPSGSMTSNPGLPEALRENILHPRMVKDLDNIIAKLRDPSLDTGLVKVIPSYIDATLPVIAETNKIDFTGLNFPTGSGRIYDIDCKGKPTVNIPAGITISNVVIVIECSIAVNPGATLTNVVLSSYRVGNGQADPLNHTNISVAANVQLGAPDLCALGGGVQFFSAASVQISSSAIIDGLQIVAAGDIQLGTRDIGINGISAQAGQDITLEANNTFGLCNGGAPNLFTIPYYRLVL